MSTPLFFNLVLALVALPLLSLAHIDPVCNFMSFNGNLNHSIVYRDVDSRCSQIPGNNLYAKFSCPDSQVPSPPPHTHTPKKTDSIKTEPTKAWSTEEDCKNNKPTSLSFDESSYNCGGIYCYVKMISAVYKTSCEKKDVKYTWEETGMTGGGCGSQDLYSRYTCKTSTEAVQRHYGKKNCQDHLRLIDDNIWEGYALFFFF